MMSDLLTLRELIVKQNGRYDLVNAPLFTNNGLDHYIQGGLRYLDNHQLSPKAYAWYKKDIVVGDYSILVQDMLSTKEVWMVNAADDRWQLDKRSLGWMKEEYYDYSIASSDSGTPIDYCETVSRLAPSQRALTSLNYDAEFTYGWEEVILEDDGPQYTYRKLWWMPKADAVATVEILGRFKSDPLSSDADTNYWLENYPEILIEATNLMLEQTYRNSTGMRDRMLSINDHLIGLDHNLVEADISGVNQMEE